MSEPLIVTLSENRNLLEKARRRLCEWLSVSFFEVEDVVWEGIEGCREMPISRVANWIMYFAREDEACDPSSWALSWIDQSGPFTG